MEIWKKIKGYEKYEVSNHGRVRRGNLIIRPYNNGLGYIAVKVRGGGIRKRFYMHRLVLQTFCPTTKKVEVNHIDHNKNNNHLENLEWVTHRDNLRKAVAFLGKSAFRRKEFA
jgi:hypothetical protein